MTTHSLEHQDLVRRLERLERQNRRLRAWTAVGLILAFLMLLARQAAVGHAQPGRAAGEQDRLALRDKDGITRAWLEMGKDGPGLILYDPQKKSRSEMTLGQGGLVFRLAGEDGRTMAGLSLQPEGVALIALDKSGKLRTGVNALTNDAGILTPKVDDKPARREP